MDWNSAGKLAKMSPNLGETDANGQAQRGDGDVALRVTGLGNHLESGQDDIAEHHDGAAAKHSLRRELKTSATAGTKLASTKIRPPERITLRLTTLVIATRPMFCANEVNGRQPNKPDTEEIKPSPAIAPAVSLSVG